MPDAVTSATILIVDDDEGLLRLMENRLRREGFSTATAHSGKDAIEWLARNTADLMFLDLKLRDIESQELINYLASIDRVVPFIIITGQGNERVAVDMMKRGALDYLVKDVQFFEFVPTIARRTLDHLAKERRLAQAEEALRRSEALLLHAQRVAKVGSYEFEAPDAPRLHWSAETFRILGRDPAQKELSLEEYLAQVVHPDDQARVRDHIQRTVNQAARYDIEYRIVRPDGSIRHVHSVCEPVLGPDNQALKVVGSFQDITERKELEKEILEISEREQSRIGQDLHDGLCQHLAGIEFRLLSLKQKLAGKSNHLAAEVTELAKLVRDGIEEARTLAHGLSPVMVQPDGLMTALRNLAASTENAFRITCSFNCPSAVLVGENTVATHLYRIAQEAIHNAIRHGKAKSIAVNLLAQSDRIMLSVKDDGAGFPQNAHEQKGIGLRIMQYRASMVGGSLVVQHEADGGTSVICSLRLTSAPGRTSPKNE